MAGQEGAPLVERRTSQSELLLPISRVKTIMKSSPDVENISQDALFAVTAATELFIKELAKKVYISKGDDLAEVTYTDLAAFVNSEDHYRGFLDEIIPLKVLGKDILAERNSAKKAAEETSDDEEASDGEEASSAEEASGAEEEGMEEGEDDDNEDGSDDDKDT